MRPCVWIDQDRHAATRHTTQHHKTVEIIAVGVFGGADQAFGKGIGHTGDDSAQRSAERRLRGSTQPAHIASGEGADNVVK